MCGIVGIISSNNASEIEKCTDVISHRGPDSYDYFKNSKVGLGHRRLSIQDLSENASQPMYSEDNNYVIIFNGEIYNHWDIRKEIEGKYKFKSTSDTETLLYAYIEYGEVVLNKLNGIFAFIIFDKQKNEIFSARDQFGVKPFYYYISDNDIVISSEIKAITKCSFFQSELNVKALSSYINYLWCPGDKTPFQDIYKLEAGHQLKINVNNLSFRIEKYYDIPFNGKYSKKTEEELIDELDVRLNKAVERQLLSDVPVGYFLSGGLDSSLIVAIAKKIIRVTDWSVLLLKRKI